jgi:L-alanine-DL-glutamate epimerase-like enolase superfamily enzyme
LRIDTLPRRLDKIGRTAGEHGIFVSIGFNEGIGTSSAAAIECCPYNEFMPAPLADSALRKELVADERKTVNGVIALPEKPGLGIELNRAALNRYAQA